MLVGSPSYMAPEVLAGGDAGPMSDVWALGVSLYELLTGEKPFRGKNAEELFAAISRGRYRRVRAVAHDCPRRIARIVERCLSRDPARRFGSAGVLARKLDACAARLLRKVHPRARLVALLANRGYVTEEIALSRVDLSTLAATRIADAKGSPTLTSFPVRRLHRRARAAFVTLVALAAGAAVFWARI
jgi:serine/threonine-protein kinase